MLVVLGVLWITFAFLAVFCQPPVYSQNGIELALAGVEQFLWVLDVFTCHAKKWIRIGLFLSTIDFALVKKYVETFIDPDPRRPADGIGFGLTMGAKTVEVIAMAAIFFYPIFSNRHPDLMAIYPELPI
jgi:hypothetical protein